ncbi:hypothetical protein FACS189431_2370 [Alphaproteobacteria bacterium]|nr:hypothetical protein FACS189431_2370 [Alphaproteobacteria bacterium]
MAQCNGQETFFEWTNSNGECGIIPVIIQIFNWLAIGVSIIVVLMVIVGAIRYMTAGGNQEGAKKGIAMIRNAIIALVLYMVMWALLNFLVPGGIFSA